MDESKIIENNKGKYNELYTSKKGIAVTAEWDPGVWASQVESLEEKELEYKVQLAFYERNAQAAKEGFDNVPLTYFDFGRAAWLVALAYGCPMIKANGLINAKYLFNDLDDAKGFVKIDKPWEKGLYPEIFNRIKEFERRYPHIPITISDNQSPNDVLTTILNSEEAMVGMLTEPEIIEKMLDSIAETIIEINRHFEKEINNFGGFQCASYLPFGMHISDDNAAFLSPDTYKDFSGVYNERLAEEFGGIAFHCCMGQEQNIKNMANTKGFIGLDTMPDYNNPDKVIEALDNVKGVWNLYNYPHAVKPENQGDTVCVARFKELIDKVEGRFALLINVYNPDKETAMKMADEIKNYATRI